jgi:hypothetical protein
VAIDRIEREGGSWWRATCLLRTSLLEALYERSCDFSPGHRMRGNFYKCGDHTESPHWGSWAEVERVDFHAPHLFGELIVVFRKARAAGTHPSRQRSERDRTTQQDQQKGQSIMKVIVTNMF